MVNLGIAWINFSAFVNFFFLYNNNFSMNFLFSKHNRFCGSPCPRNLRVKANRCSAVIAFRKFVFIFVRWPFNKSRRMLNVDFSILKYWVNCSWSPPCRSLYKEQNSPFLSRRLKNGLTYTLRCRLRLLFKYSKAINITRRDNIKTAIFCLEQSETGMNEFCIQEKGSRKTCPMESSP